MSRPEGDAPRKPRAWWKAYGRVKAAEEQLEMATVLALPLGAEVFYYHGEQCRWGTVIHHGTRNRVRLQSRRGAVYWIDAWSVLAAMSPEVTKNARMPNG